VPDKRSQFLNLISGRWENSIPLKTLWVLTFDNLPGVLFNVNKILGPTGGDAGNMYETERVNSSLIKFPIAVNNINDEILSAPNHSLLAQKVSFPTDTVVSNYTSNQNMGGLYGGYYTSNRENYQSITVSFLETNKDIIDLLFRPWLIATSYMGFIEESPDLNIKTNMNVTVYGKYTTTDWKARKKYIFEGVQPTAVPGDELSYDKDYSIIRDVMFHFKRYYIIDPEDNAEVIVGPIEEVES
jgi:hypothetical protein